LAEVSQLPVDSALHLRRRKRSLPYRFQPLFMDSTQRIAVSSSAPKTDLVLPAGKVFQQAQL
jgi:hypothetical protein